MTRIFYFDEQGTFLSKDVPYSPQELKRLIIARTLTPELQLLWEGKSISVHIVENAVIVTPPGCSGEEQQQQVPIPNLTIREQEVLEALVEGLEYKEIGQRLSISTATVKVYVTALKRKFNVDNPISVVARAVALEMCSPKFDQKR